MDRFLQYISNATYVSFQEPSLNRERCTQSTAALISFPNFCFLVQAGEGIRNEAFLPYVSRSKRSVMQDITKALTNYTVLCKICLNFTYLSICTCKLESDSLGMEARKSQGKVPG